MAAAAAEAKAALEKALAEARAELDALKADLAGRGQEASTAADSDEESARTRHVSPLGAATMDAAAAAPPAGYDALVRQLSRQLSLSSESDDAPVNLADLPAELLALILYRLLLAHDIAQLAPLCSALRDAARLVFEVRPYSRDVLTLAGHTDRVYCCLLYTSPSPRDS